MSCLILGSMNGLTQSQKLQYTQAASTFIRVRNFNTTVKTNREAGNKSLSYYVFTNNTEKALYILGQFVLSQNNPTGARNGEYNDVVQN